MSSPSYHELEQDRDAIAAELERVKGQRDFICNEHDKLSAELERVKGQLADEQHSAAFEQGREARRKDGGGIKQALAPNPYTFNPEQFDWNKGYSYEDDVVFQEAQQAAYTVNNYAARSGFKNWCIGPVAERAELERVKGQRDKAIAFLKDIATEQIQGATQDQIRSMLVYAIADLERVSSASSAEQEAQQNEND